MHKDEAIQIARAALIRDFGRDLPLATVYEIMPHCRVFFQKAAGLEMSFDDRMVQIDAAAGEDAAVSTARNILRQRTGCDLPVKYVSTQRHQYAISFKLDDAGLDVHHITVNVDVETGAASLVKSI